MDLILSADCNADLPASLRSAFTVVIVRLPLPDRISNVLQPDRLDLSETTLTVYRAAWRDLLEWWESTSLDDQDSPQEEDPRGLPPPDVIAGYLRARRDLARSTLTNRRQAIRTVYDELRALDPFDDPEVAEVWQELQEEETSRSEPPKRRPGEAEHSPAEIIEDGPRLLISHLGWETPEDGNSSADADRQGGLPEWNALHYLPVEETRDEELTPGQRQLILEPTFELKRLRNRALLLIVATTSATRAEVTGIEIEDLFPPEDPSSSGHAADPIRILLYDRSGTPESLLHVGRAPQLKYCPNRAVAAWILAADLQEGPLFRSLTPHGDIGDQGIRPQTINHVIKGCAEEAGVDDPEAWTTKKLRA